jgi:ribosomal protein S8
MVSQDKDKTGAMGTSVVHIRQAIMQALALSYLCFSKAKINIKWIIQDNAFIKKLWIAAAFILFLQVEK